MVGTEVSSCKGGHIRRRYGSKTGLLRYYGFRALYSAGFFRSYLEIEWSKIERVIFVCKGNVCRSPYAEAVAKLRGIESISCGIEAGDGVAVNDRARRVAMFRGIDLSRHRSLPITKLPLAETDLVVAMEPWHARYMESYSSSIKFCTLLGLWSRPAAPYLHDPYGCSEEHFSICFDVIDQSIDQLAAKLHESGTV